MPAWQKTLGVKLPVTLDDTMKAFRNKCKKAHPDAGGSHEQMIVLCEAVAEARAAL